MDWLALAGGAAPGWTGTSREIGCLVVDINDMQFNVLGPSEGVWSRRAPDGLLYVLKFSSGWVKVGRTAAARSDDERIAGVGRSYREMRGWEITDGWTSEVRLSTVKGPGQRSADLDEAEGRVKRHAAELGVRLSDVVDPKGCTGETEVFFGPSFAYLCAYADVVSRCT